MGEGEITFTQIIEKFLSKEQIENVAGIAFCKDGILHKTEERDLIDSLDLLPFPDYNLINCVNYTKYLNYGYNRRKQGVIFSSRGCPYRCIYCHRNLGDKYRERSAQNIFQEINDLYKHHKIVDFFIVDDIFNYNYKRSIELFEMIIKSKLKIKIYFPNGLRGDIIDTEYIDKMVEAGTIYTSFSIETASTRIQKMIKKNIDLDKTTEIINYTCSKNIMVNVSSMFGFPTELLSECHETLNHMMKFKKIAIPYFFSVKYFPATEIYQLALKHGFNEKTIDQTCKKTFHDIRSCETPTLSYEDFKKLYFTFLEQVFLNKERIENAINIMKRHLTIDEINDMFSVFFRKDIKCVESEVLAYAK